MSTRWSLLSLSVIISLGLISLAGCSTMAGNKNVSASGTAELLEPQVMLKFTDIPVPTGFKALPQESYSFESSGVRVAVLKYQGKQNLDRVVNFYKEQMAMYSWSLLNAVEYGQRLLNFERDNESCIITLAAKGSVVIITITLGPKAQIQTRKTEKADKPLK